MGSVEPRDTVRIEPTRNPATGALRLGFAAVLDTGKTL
jgi:hypothetical protein